jgi:SAM-dependent methyltransferase
MGTEYYGAINRANWDERAPAHAASEFYDVQRFIADPAHLSDVVRFDMPRLGDISGQRGVHLQCHIGTDTISLSRLGASMTGVDFSGAAIKAARDLAGRTGADATFVESDLYEAPAAVGEEAFDFVFTGIGALCWLPSISRWGQVVADVLRPGGRLFIREGHPVLWAMEDEREDDLLVVKYPYFERDEPLVFDQGGSYATTDVEYATTVTHEWNHGIGEIVSALLDAGLAITALTEHDTVPWEALPGLMERDERGEWRLADAPWRLPCSYTLQAVKRT